MPPSGTVSMWEPVSTLGAEALNEAAPRPPNTFPAPSTHACRPAARISASSQARASSWGGLQQERVTPPPGRAPKRASAAIRAWSRAAFTVVTAKEYSLDTGGDGSIE